MVEQKLWYVPEPPSGMAPAVYDQDNHMIALVPKRNGFDSMANAHFIATAPEMIDVLESIGMDEDIDLQEGVVMVSIKTMEKVYDVIAKAKGIDND